ncbi:MAG: tetratricopeptide repeat protein, partial [Bryobacterales bacterium]|nr:tetratricopeptide repeat protein [Bryobacterales bacterium]
MSTTRVIWKWLVPVAAPILFLAALEGALRIAGSGHDASFFLPHPAHTASVTTNPRYGERFFPRRIARTPVPAVFSRSKPPGTVRVFVLGESAAMGFPDPAWGLPAQLEAVLRTTHSRAEVINAAMTAIDSRVVREIAEECVRYQPDWLVVYTGNNEFIGPFSGTAQPLAAARLLLTRTRLGQFLTSPMHPPLHEWKGLEMFEKKRIAPGDPRIQRVHRSFRDNLSAIAHAGKAVGAKVIFSTVAVNLRDCPPFAGDAANEAYARGDFAAARDLDELKIRATSTMNRIIAEVAKEQGAVLVDAATAIPPDARHFFEHVHLTPAGNRALAALIARSPQSTLEESAWDRARMSATIAALTARPPFSLQQGHTQRQRLLEEQTAKLRAAVDFPSAIKRYAEQLHSAPHGLILRERYAELLHESGDPAAAADEWRELIRRLPLVKSWHTGLAESLLSAGKPAEARDAALRALALDPGFIAAQLQIGLSYAQQGDLPRAILEFERAAQQDPGSADAHNNLGVALSSLGKRTEALAAYRRAIAARPDFARAHDNLARLLASTGQTNEAIAEYRLAIRHDPTLVSAQYDLGVLLARSGQ